MRTEGDPARCWHQRQRVAVRDRRCARGHVRPARPSTEGPGGRAVFPRPSASQRRSGAPAPRPALRPAAQSQLQSRAPKPRRGRGLASSCSAGTSHLVIVCFNDCFLCCTCFIAIVASDDRRHAASPFSVGRLEPKVVCFVEFREIDMGNFAFRRDFFLSLFTEKERSPDAP